MIRCIFCDDEFTNVEGLRTHSRDCEKHPAVIEAERLRSVLLDPVGRHCSELWGLLCPDMGPEQFEREIRKIAER